MKNKGTIRKYPFKYRVPSRSGLVSITQYYRKIQEVGDQHRTRRIQHECAIQFNISRHLQWLVENQPEAACQYLSNTCNKRVMLSCKRQSYWTTPKTLSYDYEHRRHSGGCVRSFKYSRWEGPKKVFSPDILASDPDQEPPLPLPLLLDPECDHIEVMIQPHSDHYLFNAEYTKRASGPCLCCFIDHGRTTWLKGSGTKSRHKTKGYKRQYRYDLRELGI